MAVNLNILGPFMEYQILSNVDSRLIIAMHGHGSRLSINQALSVDSLTKLSHMQYEP